MTIVATQNPNRAEARWDRPGRPTVAGAEYDLATLMPSKDSAVKIAVNHVGEDQINRNLAWGRAQGDERGEYAYVELREMSPQDRANVEQAWTDRGMEGKPKDGAMFRLQVDQTEPLKHMGESEASEVGLDMYYTRWHQVATDKQTQNSVNRMTREDDTRTTGEKISDGARLGAALGGASMGIIAVTTIAGVLMEFGAGAVVESAATGMGLSAAGVAAGVGVGAAAGAALKSTSLGVGRMKEWAQGLERGQDRERRSGKTRESATGKNAGREGTQKSASLDQVARHEVAGRIADRITATSQQCAAVSGRIMGWRKGNPKPCRESPAATFDPQRAGVKQGASARATSRETPAADRGGAER